MRTLSKKANRQISAQSGSLLLGLALAALFYQSAVLCSTGYLSGFGWALLASLAGCFFTTLTHWSELIRTPVPELRTWKRAAFSGILLSAGLVAMGHSLTFKHSAALNIIALAFIPCSRALWRRVSIGDALNTAGERWGAILLLISASFFLAEEAAAVYSALQLTGPTLLSGELNQLILPELPRTFAFMAALLFGAASSLQNPQNRTIPSRTFWTIPTAISAITLSACGWLAIHVHDSRAIVMGPIETLPVHRLLAFTPAMLFGVVMLGMRPQIHIRNSLRIGRELTHWWQFLGLMSGLALVLVLDSSSSIMDTDLLQIAILLAGQVLTLRMGRPLIKFAPSLASVPISSLDDQQAPTTNQN